MTETDKRQDKEADRFARALLMPENMIRAEFERLQAGGRHTLQEAVKSLSKTFKVEQVQVTIRLSRDLKLIG